MRSTLYMIEDINHDINVQIHLYTKEQKMNIII